MIKWHALWELDFSDDSLYVIYADICNLGRPPLVLCLKFELTVLSGSYRHLVLFRVKLYAGNKYSNVSVELY